MPFSIGDGYIIEAKVICQMQNQTAYNVVHFFTSGLVGTIDITDVLGTLESAVAAPIKALLTDSADYRGMSCQVLSPALSSVTYRNVGAGPGTAGSTPMPKQVAGLISKRAAVGGRHGVGRIYVPFPDEVENEADATCTASYRTRMATYGAALLIPYNVVNGGSSIDIDPIILDKTTFLFTDVDTLITRDRWGTQRRRGDYGASSLPPI